MLLFLTPRFAPILMADLPGGGSIPFRGPFPNLLASSNDEAAEDQGAKEEAGSSGEKRDEILALYVELREPLLRYTLRYRVDLAPAEELVQEAFVALVEQRQRGTTVRQPRAWLFRVVRNLILRHRRNERTEAPWKATTTTQLPDLAAEEMEVRDPQPTPAEAALAGERESRLLAAIAGLSDSERECLELRAEGLSYREIAEVLATSPSTVGDWIRRAISTLKKVCED